MNSQRELRTLRARIRDRARALDAVPLGGSSNPPQFVQVVTKVGVPTATGKYFAVQAVDPGGDEGEGNTGTLTLLDGVFYCCVVGTRVPVAGDYLMAYAISGRWVADSQGMIPCPVAVLGCLNAGVSGADVTLSQAGTPIASGTTNVAGRLCVSIPNGTYDVAITPPSGSGFAAYTGTITYSGTQQNITLSADADHVCTTCCNDPIPKTLYTTDSLGTHTLTWDGTNWKGTATTTGYGPVQGDCTTTGPMTVSYSFGCSSGRWSFTIGWAGIACQTTLGDQYAQDSNDPIWNFPYLATGTGAILTSCSPLAISFDVPTTAHNDALGQDLPTPGGGGTMDVTP